MQTIRTLHNFVLFVALSNICHLINLPGSVLIFILKSSLVDIVHISICPFCIKCLLSVKFSKPYSFIKSPRNFNFSFLFQILFFPSNFVQIVSQYTSVETHHYCFISSSPQLHSLSYRKKSFRNEQDQYESFKIICKIST